MVEWDLTSVDGPASVVECGQVAVAVVGPVVIAGRVGSRLALSRNLLTANENAAVVRFAIEVDLPQNKLTIRINQ